MNTFTKAVAAGALIIALQAPLMAVQAPVQSAEARAQTSYERHRERVCRNRGTAIGVVAGAILGNSISGHHRTTGTVVGAGVGGAAGRAISEDECRRKYDAQHRRRR